MSFLLGFVLNPPTPSRDYTCLYTYQPPPTGVFVALDVTAATYELAFTALSIIKVLGHGEPSLYVGLFPWVMTQ